MNTDASNKLNITVLPDDNYYNPKFARMAIWDHNPAERNNKGYYEVSYTVRTSREKWPAKKQKELFEAVTSLVTKEFGDLLIPMRHGVHIEEPKTTDSEVEAYETAVYYDLPDGGVVSINVGTYGMGLGIGYDVVTLDSELCGKLSKLLFDEFYAPHEEKRGSIHTIVSTKHGLTLQVIGYPGVPLVRDNYGPEVLKDLDFVFDDLLAENPSGPLTILEGPPGTGKSYIVRAVVEACSLEATCAIVNTRELISMSGPDLLKLFLDSKEEDSHGNPKPFLLVVEDGDQLLVPRASDNIFHISELLNLTDGVVGGLLNLRIIVTTNARETEFDEAIMRPGRLSRHIKVPKLTAKQANHVWNRLRETETEEPYYDEVTLAEIYTDFRDPSRREHVARQASKKRRVGFGG